LFEINERITAPNFVLHFLPRKYFLGARGKQGEHFARLRSEVKKGITLAQFTGLRVKLERSEAEKKRVVSRAGQDPSFLRSERIIPSESEAR